MTPTPVLWHAYTTHTYKQKMNNSLYIWTVSTPRRFSSEQTYSLNRHSSKEDTEHRCFSGQETRLGRFLLLHAVPNLTINLQCLPPVDLVTNGKARKIRDSREGMVDVNHLLQNLQSPWRWVSGRACGRSP